jgi:hypothetical protein
LGNKRGISKDIPNEHHWWNIDWSISGCNSLLVVITYCNHKQLDSDKLQGVIQNPFVLDFQVARAFSGPVQSLPFSSDEQE